MKRGDPLLDPLLPPKDLRISLPAISIDEAEMILQLVDQLHDLLWDAYGEAVNEHMVDDHAPDASEPTDGNDQIPDF